MKKFKANSGWEIDEGEVAAEFNDFDIEKVMKKIREETILEEMK